MDNLSNISYEEGWKSAVNPVRYVKNDINPDNQLTKSENKKAIARPLVTIIQIILCLLIIISAFIIKSFGGESYRIIKKAYQTELNNEIIMNPYENNLDNLFNAAED